MPFKVKYDIYEPNKKAPCIQTFDRLYAWAELNDRQRKPGMALTRLVPVVIPEELTTSEQYVYLVYQVRKAIHKFFDGGRKKEDYDASMDLEKQLDGWNTRIRYHLRTHPKYRIDDEKAHAFFLLVEAWREKWHKYFAYKKQKDHDPAIREQMKRECYDYEDKIDKYVKQVIGL